jgi:hypothetical protein
MVGDGVSSKVIPSPKILLSAGVTAERSLSVVAASRRVRLEAGEERPSDASLWVVPEVDE